MGLPKDAQERKDRPIARGLLDYFPDACAEVAHVSFVANEQHNPGEPMHWAKEKSTDEADALVRHLLERGTFDSDGLRHSAKVAWRGLALLQRELDAEAEAELTKMREDFFHRVNRFVKDIDEEKRRIAAEEPSGRYSEEELDRSLADQPGSMVFDEGGQPPVPLPEDDEITTIHIGEVLG